MQKSTEERQARVFKRFRNMPRRSKDLVYRKVVFLTATHLYRGIVMGCGKNGLTLQIKISEKTKMPEAPDLRFQLSRYSMSFDKDPKILTFSVKDITQLYSKPGR